MVLLRILPDVTGSGKSKMGAVKQEVFISPLLDKIATKFQRLSQVFAVQEHKYINTNIDRCTKMTQIQDGGRKTRCVYMSFLIRISPLLDEIATKFQRLPHVVSVREPNGDRADTARCNRKSEIQDGGQEIGSTHISASIQDRNAFPTAKPPFLGSTNSAALL